MPGLRSENAIRVCLAALVVGLAGLLTYRIYDLLSTSWRDRLATLPKTVTPAGALPADEQQTIRLFDNAVPSIVYVKTFAETENPWQDEPEALVGGASGFVWESNYVVTCYHVVKDVLEGEPGKQRLKVYLRDGSYGAATVVGVDEDSEIAVLKVDIDPRYLRPIPLASSKEVRVGQRAYVIGNPYGREYTLTGGLISALDREIESINRRKIQGAIQTDAAVNFGNSGGPLLDSAGRLIGMIASVQGQNLGFAIPSDTLNTIVPELIRNTRISRPGLGVQFYSDRESAIYRFQNKVPHGLFVLSVVPGSIANHVGIRRFDVVESIDGHAVDSREEFLSLMDKRKIGDTVKLQVLSNGVERTINTVLQERRPF